MFSNLFVEFRVTLKMLVIEIWQGIQTKNTSLKAISYHLSFDTEQSILWTVATAGGETVQKWHFWG